LGTPWYRKWPAFSFRAASTRMSVNLNQTSQPTAQSGSGTSWQESSSPYGQRHDMANGTVKGV
jgi:hypothetical protein